MTSKLNPETQVIKFHDALVWHRFKYDRMIGDFRYFRTLCRKHSFAEHWIDGGGLSMKKSTTTGLSICKQCKKQEAK